MKFYKVKDKHKELISLDIDGKYIGAILVLIFLVAVVVCFQVQCRHWFN